MKTTRRTLQRLGWLAALGTAALLAGCERPPIDLVQSGYRGTGMLQVYNPRSTAQVAAANQAPPALSGGTPDGPKASQLFKNVQVLGDLSIGQFTSQMAAITAWVSPVEGCNYCHNPDNLAEDSKYTKVVSRRMLQMTRRINADWKTHVVATGVTCYTCHRGQPVPALAWTAPLPQNMKANFMGNRNGQNEPAKSVGLMSLPSDPLSAYLVDPAPIRIAGTSAITTQRHDPIQSAEGTYALMVHLSNSLGVNCTFCHNTQSFGSWQMSPPQRTVAWHGIRMVRELNTEYLLPLGKVLPPNRLGPTGDAPKAACATCHQGVNKPLYGAAMAKDFPGLTGPDAAASAPVLALASSDKPGKPAVKGK
jgi:photosynthetic reaction center cytochrome c subunit